MKQTDQSLLEQMRFTEQELELRWQLLGLSDADAKRLRDCRPALHGRVKDVVAQFYEILISFPDNVLLIGDAGSLARLHDTMQVYILDLFSGVYDLDYVNQRLRIGLVHKRIGVEPKFYLSSVNVLKELLAAELRAVLPDADSWRETVAALGRLLMFDTTLVVDTYIRCLVSEVDIARVKTEQYARAMEEKVKARTRQLEELSCTDPLTGLLNVRHFHQLLATVLRACQRRAEPVTLIYLDIDDFKQVNDSQGHQRGDELLRQVGSCIRGSARVEDLCIRYGGDEFCILLANCSESQARAVVVDRLRARIAEQEPGLTLSIGIAQTGPDEYLNGEALIRLADQRMYAAKRTFKALRGTPTSH